MQTAYLSLFAKDIDNLESVAYRGATTREACVRMPHELAQANYPLKERLLVITAICLTILGIAVGVTASVAGGVALVGLALSSDVARTRLLASHNAILEDIEQQEQKVQTVFGRMCDFLEEARKVKEEEIVNSYNEKPRLDFTKHQEAQKRLEAVIQEVDEDPILTRIRKAAGKIDSMQKPDNIPPQRWDPLVSRCKQFLLGEAEVGSSFYVSLCLQEGVWKLFKPQLSQ